MSVLVLIALISAAPGDADLARRAAEAFERGLARRQKGEKSRALFAEAIADYEELRRRGARNALLERNLGNAHLLAGDLPRAILAYRRGLRLAPADRVLRRNLAHARARVLHLAGSGLGRPPDDLRPAWLLSAPRSLFALAVAAYACLWACLTRWYMVRRARWLVLAALALVVAAGPALLLVIEAHLESRRPVVVIAANGVLLRKGHGRSFPPRFDTPLARGVEASLLFQRDGWLQIELSGGEVGWVHADDAVVEEGEEP
jgi:tetratricopeptide (TPR) repeat protein